MTEFSGHETDKVPANDVDAKWDAKATARISAYLDGELTQDESSEFEEHLKTEPEVQEHFDQMKRMLGALGSLPDIEAPPDFYDQVRRKMRRSKLTEEDNWLSSVVLPFQVLSIIIILAAAAIFLMAELDREHRVDENALPETQIEGQIEGQAAQSVVDGQKRAD